MRFDRRMLRFSTDLDYRQEVVTTVIDTLQVYLVFDNWANIKQVRDSLLFWPLHDGTFHYMSIRALLCKCWIQLYDLLPTLANDLEYPYDYVLISSRLRLRIDVSKSRLITLMGYGRTYRDQYDEILLYHTSDYDCSEEEEGSGEEFS
jgi:hypothetical protein